MSWIQSAALWLMARIAAGVLWQMLGTLWVRVMQSIDRAYLESEWDRRYFGRPGETMILWPPDPPPPPPRGGTGLFVRDTDSTGAK